VNDGQFTIESLSINIYLPWFYSLCWKRCPAIFRHISKSCKMFRDCSWSVSM